MGKSLRINSLDDLLNQPEPTPTQDIQTKSINIPVGTKVKTIARLDKDQSDILDLQKLTSNLKITQDGLVKDVDILKQQAGTTTIKADLVYDSSSSSYKNVKEIEIDLADKARLVWDATKQAFISLDNYQVQSTKYAEQAKNALTAQNSLTIQYRGSPQTLETILGDYIRQRDFIDLQNKYDQLLIRVNELEKRLPPKE